jgi:hypothetical protein
MWIPASADELEKAVVEGLLEESSQLDFKGSLPDKNNNADIAVDVSAMTVDGGVLVYGVAEDENKRPTRLSPIELTGTPERVDQILRTSVHESPVVRFEVLASVDDPARGYVVVIVPPSPRAPHQVVAAGKYQYRYYGRGATGNRILTEAEIARLYARRQSWSINRRDHLQTVIDGAPFDPSPDLGYLHAFVRPVVIDDDLWTRAAGDDTNALQRRISNASRLANDGLRYDPALADAANWTRHGADIWRFSREHEGKASYSALCDVNFDGRGQLFCGRVADRLPPKPYEADQPGRLVIFEQIVAGNLASFFALMGELYAAAGYAGVVDIGIALTGIQGTQALSVAQNLVGSSVGYPDSRYATDLQVNAEDLEQPRDLTRRALRRFFDALVRPDFDAFGS